ncbi:MAG: hypothetical protein ACFFDN_10255 [Candidatus Hodarchaeota archaeon]
MDKLIIDFCDYYPDHSNFLKINVDELFNNRRQKFDGLFKLASELKMG